jgi:hypothetical protein
MARRGEALILLLLGLPTAVIDWQIGQTWRLPLWVTIVSGGMALVAFGCVALLPDARAAASATAVATLYGLPIVGGIIRAQLVHSPMLSIGDGAYQIQVARDILMRGVDPYGFNYVGTGMERAPWSQPFANPSLHHLDYWPGTLLVPLPVQAIVKALLGWWDERLWLLAMAVAIWLILGRLAPGPVGRMAAVAMFLLPGHSLLAVLGDNDLTMVVWLLAAALAMARRRWILSGLLLGIAIATKQTAVLAIPVFFAWGLGLRVARRQLLEAIGAGLATVMLFLLPFLVWNWRAFIDDTVIFNFGGGSNTYPIQGIGLSALLLQLGVIHGARDAFPFLLIQLPLVAGAWAAGWRWLGRHPFVGDAMLWLGIAFFVFLFTNRFTQPTYLLLAVEVILAGLILRLRRPAASSSVKPSAAAA